MEKTELKLTCIFEKCNEGYVVHFAEFDCAISQGETKLEAFRNLCELVSNVATIELSLKPEDEHRTNILDDMPVLKE